MEKKKMIILSGPSGSGKTTISKELLSNIPKLDLSISCTTRRMRNNEQDKKDYYFISEKQFLSKINKNQFVEWEEVYKNLYYGTLKSEIYRIWNNNRHILFDIDVKGSINIKKKYPNKSLSIFIMIQSLNILKYRLINRNTENFHKIKIRLKRAKKENNLSCLFDFILPNINWYDTKKKVVNIVKNFLSKKNDIGVTGFEPATARPPDVNSNQSELHPD